MASDEPYTLTVELRDPDVIGWVRGLPEHSRDYQVEQALSVGRQVLTFIRASTSEENMKQLFRPMLDRMDKLDEHLDTMLRYADKSQRLGELGETIVTRHLQAAFPTDTFELVSRGERQADVHAHFHFGDEHTETALVEAKLYSNAVPTTELKKFWNDLRTQQRRYGLMVSLSSGFANKDGPLSVEATDDHLVVYVPHAGLDGTGVYWGAALLRQLMVYEWRTRRRIPTGAIEQAFERLHGELDELSAIARQLVGLKDALSDARQTIGDTLDRLVDQTIRTEARLSHTVERLGTRLVDELQALPRTTDETALPEPDSPDDVLAFLDDLDHRGDKRAPAFRALWDRLRHLDHVSIACADGHWHVYANGRLVAETTGPKNRLDVVLPLDDPDAELRLRPSLETVNAKRPAVVVNGNDPEAAADRVAEHLRRGS